MNRKLPNIYKSDKRIKSSNRDAYYSFKDSNENILIDKKSTESSYFDDNFFQYFNKDVEISLKDGKYINARILSKSGNRVMLNDGSYIDVGNINSIK